MSLFKINNQAITKQTILLSIIITIIITHLADEIQNQNQQHGFHVKSFQ